MYYGYVDFLVGLIYFPAYLREGVRVIKVREQIMINRCSIWGFRGLLIINYLQCTHNIIWNYLQWLRSGYVIRLW